jgi:hypothetical protein
MVMDATQTTGEPTTAGLVRDRHGPTATASVSERGSDGN